MESVTEKVLDPLNLSEKFGAVDYVVFIGMLGVSAGIGVAYGCCGKQQSSTSEFLMAGRNMGTFPVAMSLLASFISAIALLGIPAEVYLNGTMYWVMCLSVFLVMGASAHLYLPVFYNLQLTSAYEYLELRFSKPVRMLGSSMFILQMTIYMSIVVYAPALALSQVTGLNVYGCVTGIFGIVTFYTALGGMKAVMWTDVVQTIIMFAAIIAVIVKGTFDLGGFSNVWRIADEGGRIEFFNVNPDPRERHTVWSLFIGAYFMWVALYGVNQAQVQRYLTVPTIKKAQIAIWMNIPGLIGVISICAYAGLVIYAKYAGCDPLASKRVTTADQLFPLFVMDTLGDLHGFPGLFVAGVFSGALSTVSSGLNSLAAITLEDFVKYYNPNMEEKTSTKVSKILAVVYGLIAFALVFVAEQLGGVLQAALTIFGVIGGPVLGVFTLGMCFPWANSKGAFGGTIISFAFMTWLGIGANVSAAKKLIVHHKLPVRLDECLYGNFTLPVPPTGSSGGLLEFYRISYMWFSLLGFFGTIVSALVISFLTGAQDPKTLDPRLISPAVDRFVKWAIPKRVREFVQWDIGVNKEVRLENNLPKFLSAETNRTSKNGISNPAFNDKDLNVETKV